MLPGPALLLALLAPARADAPEAPEVALHTRGRRPRVALRLDLHGGRQEVDVVTEASLHTAAIVPIDVVMPASTVTLAATPSGGSVRVEVTAVSVAELESDPLELRQSMLQGLEPWVGQAGTAAITDAGLASWTLAADSDVTLMETMDILVPALPARPVGVGARWSTSTTSDMDGQPLVRTLTWTLVEHRGEVLVLDLVGEDTLEDVDEGLDFSSTGSGRVEWNLTRPLPAASTWAQEMTMKGTAAAEGMEIPMDTRAGVQLTLTSR